MSTETAATAATAAAGTTTTTTPPPVTDIRTYLDEKGTITKPDDFFKGIDGAEHLSKRFTSVEALAKSYVNAERMLSNGNKIPLPSETSTEGEWNAFYDRIRGVKTEDEYKVEAPEALKDAAFDAEAVKQFKGAMFKAGAPAKVVEAAAKWYFERAGKIIEAGQQAQQAKLDAAQADLVKEWGPAEGAKFKEQLALAEKGAAAAGLTAEILKASPELSNNPHYIRAMAKVGAMIGEKGAANLRPGAGQLGEDVDAEIKATLNNKSHPFHVKGHPDHQKAIERMQFLFNKKHPEAA